MTEPVRHFLCENLSSGAISVLLIGCGGNGGQMAMGLASLDVALRAISPRHLDVTIIDDDTVSEANLGRQPFYRCDIGRSKAHTMVERLNMAHGLAWRGVHGRAPRDLEQRQYDLVISCVDTASARRDIGFAVARNKLVFSYWLDLGNRATDGQFILGSSESRFRHDNKAPRLKTVLEHFPELADESLPEDNTPSCSVAEALERQSLFMNRVLSSHALALLFELLGRGSIGTAGGFVDIATGQVVPVPLVSSFVDDLV